MKHDVIVLGGGTAGVAAAIQAARAGAQTLLVEKTGLLGGTMTNGGVNNPGLFFAGTRQVIAGIGWELVSRCLVAAGQELPAATRSGIDPEAVSLDDLDALLQQHAAIVPDNREI